METLYNLLNNNNNNNNNYKPYRELYYTSEHSTIYTLVTRRFIFMASNVITSNHVIGFLNKRLNVHAHSAKWAEVAQ
jgi:hypothetical protein